MSTVPSRSTCVWRTKTRYDGYEHNSMLCIMRASTLGAPRGMEEVKESSAAPNTGFLILDRQDSHCGVAVTHGDAVNKCEYLEIRILLWSTLHFRPKEEKKRRQLFHKPEKVSESTCSGYSLSPRAHLGGRMYSSPAELLSPFQTRLSLLWCHTGLRTKYMVISRLTRPFVAELIELPLQTLQRQTHADRHMYGTVASGRVRLRTLRVYVQEKGSGDVCVCAKESHGVTRKNQKITNPHHPEHNSLHDGNMHANIHADRSRKQTGWEPRHWQKLEWRRW
ncbi:hypothetical protein F5141DRAFT_1264204 [Pisolithus sp. B1]|nr:hypothetical protein F5141DRAFT_1264204 [Pisolithus sp. B1]